jgi:hypothetical protein
MCVKSTALLAQRFIAVRIVTFEFRKVLIQNALLVGRVSGSIPGGVTGNIFRSYRRNHVLWC